MLPSTLYDRRVSVYGVAVTPVLAKYRRECDEIFLKILIYPKEKGSKSMVDLSGPDTPYQHGFNNVVFVLPTIIVVGLSVFFVYKLFKCLREREQKREEKKKNKQLKKKK
ncbi:uncharacterized protein LOC124432519 isoform X1 [Vespa crabro]|uniref:uncharacterized protein LOC124432519 isoform X1 n=1 Tax=Vespa crabro TaxID=7445 RepID=UPI001F0268E1|nr:uncharacterized protein LOC124432519 isoform X1 [Vespa crabro]